MANSVTDDKNSNNLLVSYKEYSFTFFIIVVMVVMLIMIKRKIRFLSTLPLNYNDDDQDNLLIDNGSNQWTSRWQIYRFHLFSFVFLHFLFIFCVFICNSIDSLFFSSLFLWFHKNDMHIYTTFVRQHCSCFILFLLYLSIVTWTGSLCYRITILHSLVRMSEFYSTQKLNSLSLQPIVHLPFVTYLPFSS